jgi:hypothetical protein
MLTIRRDNFIRDLIIWTMVSILLAASLAAGFAALTDKYFAQAIAGLMGDVGEYDLLFTVRTDMKDKVIKDLRQITQEHFPGSVIEPGLTIAGKSTIFLTLPERYRTKAVFSSLGSYFGKLPGGGGFSLMTEPRIIVTGVPGGVYDRMIRELESVKGVKFAFRDGSSIAVLINGSNRVDAVSAEVRKVLRKYRIVEVRFPAGHGVDDMVALSRKLTQELAGKDGLNFIRDVTMGDGADDYQALLSTLSQMKRFLLSYATEIIVTPKMGVQLEVGDRLALGSKSASIRSGKTLKSEHIVIKIISITPDAIQGLIVQGDAAQISGEEAYLIGTGDKLGRMGAYVHINSRKEQLAHALDEGVALLKQAGESASDLTDTSTKAKETLTAAASIQEAIEDAQSMIKTTIGGIEGLSREQTQERLDMLAQTLSSIGRDLKGLSTSFARVRLVENRLQRALDSVKSFQSLLRIGLVAYPPTGQGIGEKLDDFDQDLKSITSGLEERARSLDDFINRFNPLVHVLLSWNNKANEFSVGVRRVSDALTNDSEAAEVLSELTGLSDEVLQTIDSLDFAQIEGNLERASQHLIKLSQIDLAAISAQMEKVRESLPNLLDEEIGQSVSLIDRYLDGEVIPGEHIRLFVNSEVNLKSLQTRIRTQLDNPKIQVTALPSGSIEPNIRGEVFRILGEVRGVIAALIVVILFVLFFLLDQSSVMAVLKRHELVVSEIPMDFINEPRKKRILSRWLGIIYAAVLGIIWFVAAFSLSGAQIPYINSLHLMMIGAALGIFFYYLADRIYQLDMDEIMAGQSLGLTFSMLMREIVIPSGRPGLLQFINSRRMVMGR